MAQIDFGFTHKCTGDLGYVWDGEVLAMMFARNGEFMVYDVRKGGNPFTFDNRADALNGMLTIAAKHKAPL